MVRYIIKRILYLVPVLIVMSIVVFSFMHLLPGDPVDIMLGLRATPAQREGLRKALGLDRNIVAQYISWAGNLLKGDFGRSLMTDQPVLQAILEKLPATLTLALAATIISVTISLFMGTVVAVHKGTYIDFFGLILALIWVSIPSFWLGILLMLGFALYIPIFPSMGYANIFTDFVAGFRHLMLPAFTLGAVMAGAITRMNRAEMIEQLNQDYVTTAWAKGLPRRVIIYKHALRNALIPFVTFSGLQLGMLLGGTVVVEQIFSWPGTGRLVIQAINARDYPLVQGIVLFMALIFVFVNLLVDISYTFLNPQIRLGEKIAA